MKYTEKIHNRQLTTVLVWTGKIYSTVEEHFHWLHQCAWKLTAQILKENAAYTFFFFQSPSGCADRCLWTNSTVHIFSSGILWNYVNTDHLHWTISCHCLLENPVCSIAQTLNWTFRCILLTKSDFFMSSFWWFKLRSTLAKRGRGRERELSGKSWTLGSKVSIPPVSYTLKRLFLGLHYQKLWMVPNCMLSGFLLPCWGT